MKIAHMFWGLSFGGIDILTKCCFRLMRMRCLRPDVGEAGKNAGR